MKIQISKKIIAKYPEVEIGIVLAKNIDNTKKNDEVNQLIEQVEKQVRENFDIEKITEIPTIAKWREVYKSFGAKPSKYRNSAEALLRRILRGDELYKINPLVDIYNYISLKHTMTVGGEDIEKIKGDLILDFAKGDEEFIALGSDKNQPPKQGEVVYKDKKGVICRNWNWREADRTKLTEETKNAVIVIENLIPEDHDKFETALNELKELIQKYCKANCETKILNKENLDEVLI